MKIYKKTEWVVLKNMLKDKIEELDTFYTCLFRGLCYFIKDKDYRHFDKFLKGSDYFKHQRAFDYMEYFISVMEAPFEELPIHIHEKAPYSSTKSTDFIVAWRLKIGK